jgi:hypothetical protein
VHVLPLRAQPHFLEAACSFKKVGLGEAIKDEIQYDYESTTSLSKPLIMRIFLKLLLTVGVALMLLALIFVALLGKQTPERISYGISFNTLYAEELGLSWREVYDAFLDDLGARRLRLAAHWPMVEPEDDAFNFEELDYQITRAEAAGASVILGVGRRLPRWPECHVPEWASELSWEAQQTEILEYIEAVVKRYKDSPAIIYWQVENEPFLTVFAYEHCGDLDKEFLDEEIALVRSLDAARPILVTDSGNLGTWYGAYSRGDAFGTSVYVHLWNPETGPFTTLLPPAWYRIKENLMELLYGEKQTFLIELSAEPWLIAPISDTDLETQFSRMNPEMFADIIEYARDTRFETQYLWGGEWWYWLTLQGEPEMWQMGKELFNN